VAAVVCGLVVVPRAAAANALDPYPSIAAAGDIACAPSDTSSPCRQQQTSDLLAGGGFDAILTLGDNQYENGELANFRRSYDLTWGRFKSTTFPSPGNHEYHQPGAPGYYDYFGTRAGPDRRGYYSFDLGSWHLISLNSEVVTSAELAWLGDDLAGHPQQCTLAYFHHSLFSSEKTDTKVLPLWNVLHQQGADVILSAHAHTYERFAPQRPDGTRDDAHGIRQWVVGTGGKDIRSFGGIASNSERRQNSSFGVLRMTLRPDGYDWSFLAIAGATFTDTGSGRCH
jgi:hypothetical protein